MDPNATLTRIRELIAIGKTHVLKEDESTELVDLISALDEWMSESEGGFFPRDWRPF
jgi:hypothetical protein